MEFLMLPGLLQHKINRECCSHQLQVVFNRREEAMAALGVDGMDSENAEKTKIGDDGESKAPSLWRHTHNFSF